MGIAAQMVGIAQGAFDVGYNYAMQRRQFGSVVGEFQGMQHQYAQVAMEIEAARMLVCYPDFAALSWLAQAHGAVRFLSTISPTV